MDRYLTLITEQHSKKRALVLQPWRDGSRVNFVALSTVCVCVAYLLLNYVFHGWKITRSFLSIVK